MVHSDKESSTHKKHKKRSRKDEESSESSGKSPPRRQKKSKTKNIQREHSHHCEGDSPSRKMKSKRKNDEDVVQDKRKDNRRRNDDSRESLRKDNRDKRKGRERSPPPVKIKKEEEFDDRQEELRRKRRRDADRHREQRHSGNVKVKQEPQSEENRRRGDGESQHSSHHGRGRRREDIDRERRENDARRAEAWRKRQTEGGQNAEALIGAADEEEPVEKEKPNLGLSGALTEDTNSFRGVVIKYSEPPEARVPTKRWRFYPFKGDEALKVLHLHRQSAYLLGKLRRIADIPIDHPSCSKQHAVLQFRLVEHERADGKKKRLVKPYIIDLDSANGTYVNNQKIDPRRYIELKEKDVVKFAYSSREYVLIHDKSDTTEVQEGSEAESEDD